MLIFVGIVEFCLYILIIIHIIIIIITREIPCTTNIIFSFVFDNFLYFQATTFETEIKPKN
jgi:hypothetical protein